MICFFSDLDNTLIYSYRKRIKKPRVVIEYLDGKDQSFMTQLTYDFLKKTDWLKVVPVTTRSEQQYRRIECPPELHFKNAIVCNGGKLLINGVEDDEWSRETYERTRDNWDALEKVTGLLIQMCGNNHVHKPEVYMSYAKCREPDLTYKKIVDLVDTNRLNVQKDGRKVYVFANGVTKGDAIERYKNRVHLETIIAAGDGLMDLSMLNIADYAFARPEIYDFVRCQNAIRIDEEPFSDGICKHIVKMKEEGIL